MPDYGEPAAWLNASRAASVGAGLGGGNELGRDAEWWAGRVSQSRRSLGAGVPERSGSHRSGIVTCRSVFGRTQMKEEGVKIKGENERCAAV